MKRILAWIGAAVLTAGLVGASSMAFAEGDSETLQACYHNSTGALRVDVSGDGCRPNETPVAVDGMGLTTRVVTANDVLPDDGFGGVTAECGEGEVVLGGGFQIASINPDVAIVTNAPLTDGRQGWHATFSAGAPVEVWAFAVCTPGAAAS